MERTSATYHLYAMYHTFGPPAFLITFAPKTLTNELMLTFGAMQEVNKIKQVDIQLPRNLQHRVKILTSNTVAQARAYVLLVEAVMSALFGIRPIHTAKKQHKPISGLFGVTSACYGVTEVRTVAKCITFTRGLVDAQLRSQDD